MPIIIFQIGTRLFCSSNLGLVTLISKREFPDDCTLIKVYIGLYFPSLVIISKSNCDCNTLLKKGDEECPVSDLGENYHRRRAEYTVQTVENTRLFSEPTLTQKRFTHGCTRKFTTYLFIVSSFLSTPFIGFKQ